MELWAIATELGAPVAAFPITDELATAVVSDYDAVADLVMLEENWPCPPDRLTRSELLDVAIKLLRGCKSRYFVTLDPAVLVDRLLPFEALKPQNLLSH